MYNSVSDFESPSIVKAFDDGVGFVSNLPQEIENNIDAEVEINSIMFKNHHLFCIHKLIKFFTSQSWSPINAPIENENQLITDNSVRKILPINDLILAINMLEVIEPSRILEKISSHVVSGYTVLSDPYDYIRGKKTVNVPLYEKDVRQKLKLLGFSIINKTNIPSSVNWTLKINPRTKLIYKVDIIIGKK